MSSDYDLSSAQLEDELTIEYWRLRSCLLVRMSQIVFGGLPTAVTAARARIADRKRLQASTKRLKRNWGIRRASCS